MHRRSRNIAIALFLIAAFVAWSVVIVWYGPENIVSMLGVENALWTLFFLAFVGGTSLFLPVPYYLVTASLGAGGINPFLLGIIAGTGTLIGDTTTYYLGYKGRELVRGKLAKRMEKALRWSTSKHPLVFPLIAYVYASVAPLPDDVLMVPAGVMRYPYLRLAPAVWLGKITFNTILAFSGLYGWHVLGT